MTAAAPAPARARALLLGAALVLGIGLAGGWLLATAGSGADAQPRVLVRASLPLGAEGAFFPFTLEAPGEVEVHVVLPEMLEGEALVGPLYAAMRPELVYEPDARDDVRIPVRGCGTPPSRHRLRRAGAYAVRIPVIPTAMGMESEMIVSVTVTAVP